MRLSFLPALICLALAGAAQAQPTAFTYQGRLKNGAQLATGLHDLRFRLFDASSGGAQVGTTQCADNVAVSDGLFTAQIDFGQQFATTAQRFLEIEVRADTGLNCSNATGFTLLSPRQLLTAAPMASHAKAAFALDAADGSPANAVFVDNNGKVGIGTTTPGAPLHIADDAFPVMVIQDTGLNSTQAGYVSYLNGTGTETGWVGYGTPGSTDFSLSNSRGALRLFSQSGDAILSAAGNVGIGTIAPAAKLEVRGDILLGPTGQLNAASGEEKLRMVRGIVLTDGNTFAGAGFTANRVATGQYHVAFSPAFAGPPAVTVSAQSTVRIRWLNLSSNQVDVWTFDPSGGTFTDADISFIAVGPR